MKVFKYLPHHVQDTIYAISGIIVCGFALKTFLVPNGFLDGGVTGLSLLISEVYGKSEESKSLILASMLILANIPLIILGGYQISKSFAYKSFLCIVGLAICLQFFPSIAVTHDKLLISIFGGFFLGVGIGLAMRAGCAIDGIEVLALFTGKKMSFSISEIILGLNVIIFIIAGFCLNWEQALYSILTYFTASRSIDFIVEGLEEYTGITIISGKSEQVKEALVMKLGRGITVYKGERGFLKSSFEISAPCDIIFTVITRFEVRKLRNVVHEIDPKAFVFTNIIKEAAGGVLKRRASH